MREFKFNLRPLYRDLAIGVGVLLLFVFYRRIESVAFVVIATITVLGYRGLMHLSAACTVALGSESLSIRYLLPWKRPIELRYEQILSYVALRIPRRPTSGVLLGVLSPVDGKPVTLFPHGIQNFSDLNRILEEALPRPKPNKAPEPTTMAVTPRAIE